MNSQNIKFVCSYGGRIQPRYPDGELRYHGGETRALSVPRSVSFAELLVKLVDLCGTPVTLRCQLPGEDLDALVSITSDEDLVNLIEEYDRVAPLSPRSSLKIRAFLSVPKTSNKPTSPPSPAAAGKGSTSPKSPLFVPRYPSSANGRYIRRSTSRPPAYPIIGEASLDKVLHLLGVFVQAMESKVVAVIKTQISSSSQGFHEPYFRIEEDGIQ